MLTVQIFSGIIVKYELALKSLQNRKERTIEKSAFFHNYRTLEAISYPKRGFF